MRESLKHLQDINIEGHGIFDPCLDHLRATISTLKPTGYLHIPGGARVDLYEELPTKWQRFWIKFLTGIYYTEEPK